MTIIGSGNVATHLGRRLKASGLEVAEVYSPNREHAHTLAAILGADIPDDLSTLSPNSDLYLLCVPDRFVKTVSDKLPHTMGIVAHTSGITPMKKLNKHMNHGVFYPLQTFSKDKAVRLQNVPFCLEASSEEVLKKLSGVASSLSQTVKEVDSTTRMQLHLAAVFVNNFVNYLYTVGSDLLAENGVPFDFLVPLIEETAKKIETLSPQQAQTGPAQRNDQSTLLLHQKLLSDHPNLQMLYNQMSNQIIQKYYE